MLRPYRVLDLTDSRAELGPAILAGLGAEVIEVEPPAGSTSRVAPPIVPGLPLSLESLRFHAHNRGKESVVVDLESADGRELFRRLVASADFLFENDDPGAMAQRGLGFEELRRACPQLVYVARTRSFATAASSVR